MSEATAFRSPILLAHASGWAWSYREVISVPFHSTAPQNKRYEINERGGGFCRKTTVGLTPAHTPHSPTQFPPFQCGAVLCSYLADYSRLPSRIHDTCVINWLRDANEMEAFVANLGLTLAGNVASVQSATRKTLKSRERFW